MEPESNTVRDQVSSINASSKNKVLILSIFLTLSLLANAGLAYVVLSSKFNTIQMVTEVSETEEEKNPDEIVDATGTEVKDYDSRCSDENINYDRSSYSKYLVNDMYVCFEGVVVEGADPQTFVSFDEEYVAPKNETVWKHERYYDSFDGFDKNGYYENGKITHSVLKGNFEVLGTNYIRINDDILGVRVTGLGSLIYEYVTKHTPEFEVLEHNYAKNKNYVYYKSLQVDYFSDANEFYLDNKFGMTFGRYNDWLYYEGKSLPGLDFETMQTIQEGVVLYDDDTAYGLTGGCHFPSYSKIDYDTKDEHYNC